MTMNPKSSKKNERIVARAVTALDRAADALWELQSLIPPNVDSRIEERFATELRERARYWESCTWWRKL